MRILKGIFKSKEGVFVCEVLLKDVNLSSNEVLR